MIFPIDQRRKLRTAKQMEALSKSLLAKWLEKYLDETVFQMLATPHVEQSPSHEADSAKPREEDP